MIRINLLGNNKAAATKSDNAKSMLTNFGTSIMSQADSSGGTADIILKIALLITPVLLLYGYQEVEVGNKQNLLNDTKRKLEKVTAELTTKKTEVEKVERFKADKKQLEERVATIKSLSRARLKNVKALDAIQNILPTKAWLTKLVLNEKKVDLFGKAIEDNDISSLMQGLEENIYFMQVVLISSEQSRGQDGVVKSFNVSASMENL